MTSSSTKKPFVDHYAVMGVVAVATDRELVTAYRDLSRQLHPDKNRGDPGAADRFQRMKASYELLKDAARRAEFDGQLKAREIRFARDMAKSEKTRGLKKALEAAEARAEERARAAALAKRQRRGAPQTASAKLASLRADSQRLKQELEDDAHRAARAAAKLRAVEAGVLSPSAVTPPAFADGAGIGAQTAAATNPPALPAEVTGVTLKLKHRDQLSDVALATKIRAATAHLQLPLRAGARGGRGDVVVKLARGVKKRKRVHVFLDSMAAAQCLVEGGIPGLPSVTVEFTDKAHRSAAAAAAVRTQGQKPSPAQQQDRGRPREGPRIQPTKRERPGAGHGAADPSSLPAAASSSSPLAAGTTTTTKRPRPASAKKADLASMEDDIFAQLRQFAK